MQVQYLVYGWFKNIRYLYGLTESLALSDSMIFKLKVETVILPSKPVINNIYLWHIQAFKKLKCSNVMYSESIIKKILEPIQTNLKWQLWNQTEIQQSIILQKFNQIIFNHSIIKINSYLEQYNNKADQLYIVFPQDSNMSILINQCQIIVIDPGQRTLNLLEMVGISKYNLWGIILTRPTLNIIDIFLTLNKFVLVTSQSIYMKTINSLKNIFFFTDEMIRYKIKPRLINKSLNKIYLPLNFIDITYNYQQNSWSLFVGGKIVKIYPNLCHYPSQLQNLQYLICYNIQPKLKQQLQQIPEYYRKKIILNRSELKYSHKYFLTLNKIKNSIKIKAHPNIKIYQHGYSQFLLQQELKPNHFKTTKILKNEEQINCSDRIITITNGTLISQQGQIYHSKTQLKGFKKLKCLKNAVLIVQTINESFFNTAYKSMIIKQNQQDYLIKVKDNSFVASLNKYARKQFANIDRNTKLETVFIAQQQSEYYILNSLCQLTSKLEDEIMVVQNSIYIIIKGSVRWEGQEQVAQKNDCIGDIKSYFLQKNVNRRIQILKDSWMLKISISQLQINLLRKYPNKMYQLWYKGTIFN